jgi:hypothetical protein
MYSTRARRLLVRGFDQLLVRRRVGVAVPVGDTSGLAEGVVPAVGVRAGLPGVEVVMEAAPGRFAFSPSVPSTSVDSLPSHPSKVDSM